MPDRTEKLSRKQMTAIWAAARARGIDPHIVAEAQCAKTSLRELTRDEAHRVLDVLNGKDPQRETVKRSRFSNRAKRREEPRKRNGDGSGNGPANADNPKILRQASREQIGFICDLACRVGLTEELDASGEWVMSGDRVTRWMRKKFKTAWRPAGRVGFALAESLARKVISALRSWSASRHRKWADAYGREVADLIMELGYPIGWDDYLRRDPLPELSDFPDEMRERLRRRGTKDAEGETDA